MLALQKLTQAHHLRVRAEAGGVDEPAPAAAPVATPDLDLPEVDAHGRAGLGGAVATRHPQGVHTAVTGVDLPLELCAQVGVALWIDEVRGGPCLAAALDGVESGVAGGGVDDDEHVVAVADDGRLCPVGGMCWYVRMQGPPVAGGHGRAGADQGSGAHVAGPVDAGVHARVGHQGGEPADDDAR